MIFATNNDLELKVIDSIRGKALVNDLRDNHNLDQDGTYFNNGISKTVVYPDFSEEKTPIKGNKDKDVI